MDSLDLETSRIFQVVGCLDKPTSTSNRVHLLIFQTGNNWAAFQVKTELFIPFHTQSEKEEWEIARTIFVLNPHLLN